MAGDLRACGLLSRACNMFDLDHGNDPSGIKERCWEPELLVDRGSRGKAEPEFQAHSSGSILTGTRRSGGGEASPELLLMSSELWLRRVLAFVGERLRDARCCSLCSLQTTGMRPQVRRLNQCLSRASVNLLSGASEGRGCRTTALRSLALSHLSDLR